MLDRRGRALVSQVGTLIVINIIIGFGFANIDNIAHLGGLAAGFLLGVAVSPSGVPTMRSMWQPGDARPIAIRFIGSPIAMVASLGLLFVLLALGMALGLEKWAA